VVDDGVLAAIDATIVGFGIVVFMFRIQRMLEERDQDKEGRFPWADRLLIGIVTVSVLLVLFPIALVGSVSSFWGGRLPAAACSASTIALAGYIPALLAHYYRGSSFNQFCSRLVLARRWSWFKDQSGGVSVERIIVVVSVLLGVVAAVASVVVTG
jgi:hypothetical protein